MRGKSFFRGIYLSKKEMVTLIFLLLVMFLTAFFISGAYAKKKNANVATANMVEHPSNKDQKGLKNEGKTEEREEIFVSKKIAREERRTKAEEEARRAEELARIKGNGDKVVYLTFDDGPSTAVTPRILDTLKKYDVKATFFVIGNLVERNSWLVKREVQEGHSVGNHTYSHIYDNRDGNSIYRSNKALIDDFDKGEASIKAIISGYNSKLVRFPGGSFDRVNWSFEPFREAVRNAGYHFVDWNVDSQDTKQILVPAERIVNVVAESCAGKKQVVILMHDAPVKTTTADALPRIIEYLKEQGYTFKTLQ